ncbi:hypothetical protein EV2_039017 [Malus domestica]
MRGRKCPPFGFPSRVFSLHSKTTEFSAALQRVGDFDHASYTPHRSLPSLLRDPSDPCFLIFSISAL